MSVTAALAALRAEPVVPVADLFAAEPDRLSRMVIEAAGLRCDFSRTHLTSALLAGCGALADAAGFAAARDAVFAGMAAGGGHVAERGQGAPGDVAQARMLHARMRALIDAIEVEAIGPFRHILHLGAGGLAQGPALLIDALGDDAGRYDVAVVADVDGLALERALARCDAQATLVVVAAQDFDVDGADAATLLNAASTLSWMTDAGVDDPYGRLVAVTADPDRAVDWGIDETRVLPFAPGTDPRHALWSSAGFAVALALGWDAFETLLEGAAAMDRHFRLAEPAANMPLIAACADLYYTAVRSSPVQALLAWDLRLALLPVLVAGANVVGGTASTAGPWLSALRMPDAALVPVEFVAVVEPDDGLDAAHRRALLTDCIAQGAALLAGRAGQAGTGDRPSTTILLDRLDPATLGPLLAFYEHRRFALAVLTGRDPFAPEDDGAAAAIVATIADGGADGGGAALDPAARALLARIAAVEY